jgi:hypothetical protein
MWTVPSRGSRMPAMQARSVDLPQPLRPMTPTISPCETVSERDSKTVRAPRRTERSVIARSASLSERLLA